MLVKDFYLIESIDTSILDEPQKEFLEEQLNLFQKGSSLIEKTTALDKIIKNKKLKGIQYLYNEWLFKFVSKKLKITTVEEETQYLLKILGNCYQVFGSMFFYKNNYDRTLNSYAKALKIRKSQDDKESLFSTYQNMSIVYILQGEIASALEIYEKAAPLLSYVKKKELLGSYYVNLGVILGQQGDYVKALDYFYKSLEIFEEYNLESDVADTNANIGKLIYIQGDLSEARNYYLKSLKLYKENENEFGEAAMYTEIGIIHEKKKEYDKALKYYDKAMKIQIRLKLDGKLAYSCFQTAVLYEHQNQWNLASKYYQKSIQLSEKIGTKEMLSKALSRKGALEIKKGITEKAKEQIKLGFSLARELNDPELIKEAAAAKLTLAIATEDYKLAYEMECLKNEINNKIQNQDVRKEVIKRKFEYESKQALLKKDEEIELEKQNAQIIEEQSDLLTLKNNELASKNEIINKQMHELEDLIQKLQESNESLNQFAAVAAHDLKAPLRNIQGFSQLLYKKYTGQLPEKDIALFMHIINSCTSLKELIDGLLNYSKISNIKFKLDCVDLSELVADVKNNLSNIIKETKVVLHIAEGMPMVTGQYSLLFQVFLNFMNNAIKFRRKKEGLQSEIWVNSEFYNDDQIKISIKDNGIGIEKEHQDQIFGIFKKLHSNSEYEGSGIGLSVCKKIIERLSGKVWLESEKNVGTTFFFTLKLHLFRSKDW